MLTLTEESTAIVDVFAGCGGMGVASAELHRHCLCLEFDEAIFARHLKPLGEISITPLVPPRTTPATTTSSGDTDWAQYEP